MLSTFPSSHFQNMIPSPTLLTTATVTMSIPCSKLSELHHLTEMVLQDHLVTYLILFPIIVSISHWASATLATLLPLRHTETSATLRSLHLCPTLQLPGICGLLSHLLQVTAEMPSLLEKYALTVPSKISALPPSPSLNNSQSPSPALFLTITSLWHLLSSEHICLLSAFSLECKL